MFHLPLLKLKFLFIRNHYWILFHHRRQGKSEHKLPKSRILMSGSSVLAEAIF
ncbi:Uncharacterized protein dnm_030940 [Desulfonema magnum]|uniref:Uncharacterized protein n=1 Tax=Desulfonema magnum TaxID=45655 RepID=A0A975BK15_9BACT|nr:Uncharacterized protein dnm_030940 [Desulfonema magnum]